MQQVASRPALSKARYASPSDRVSSNLFAIKGCSESLRRLQGCSNKRTLFISCSVKAQKAEAAGSFSVFTTALIMSDERWGLYQENTSANFVSCERRQNNLVAINLSVIVSCGRNKSRSVWLLLREATCEYPGIKISLVAGSWRREQCGVPVVPGTKGDKAPGSLGPREMCRGRKRPKTAGEQSSSGLHRLAQPSFAPLCPALELFQDFSASTKRVGSRLGNLVRWPSRVTRA